MWESGYVNDPVDTPQKQQGGYNGVSNLDDDRGKVCMPLSLSHIVKYTRHDEGLVISGKKIATFTTVAMIHEIIDLTNTRLHLKLDDGTKGSPVEAIYVTTDGGKFPFEIKPGTYVRIYGHAKYQDPKPYVHPFNIGPLIDINEITMHILEVIKEMMYLESGDNYDSNKSALPHRIQQQTNNGNIPTATDPIGAPNLPTIQKYILTVLKKNVKSDSDNSIHIDTICSELKGYKREDISKALHELCHEGHVWNGDTEDLWCI